MAIPKEATHLVTGFDAAGNALLQTWHVGGGSAGIEIEVWKDRINKPGDRAASMTVVYLHEAPVRTARYMGGAWRDVH